MNAVFVDTGYWIALINPKDQWHSTAAEIKERHGNARLVTSDGVLTEVLNYFSAYGGTTRETAATIVLDILTDQTIQTVPQTRELMLKGISLYQSRLDKAYSLTDCISMVAMREHGITSTFTTDVHFTQEGFTIIR